MSDGEITLTHEGDAPEAAAATAALDVQEAVREAEQAGVEQGRELESLHNDVQGAVEQVYTHTHPEYERGEEWSQIQSQLSSLTSEMAEHRAEHSAMETAETAASAADGPEEIEIASPPPPPKRPGRSLLRRGR